jgi:hypothetical protein
MLLIVFVARSQGLEKQDSTNNSAVQGELSDLMKTASLALTDPRLAAAIELIKNLKTESSTSIGQVHDAKAGFYEFDTSFEISSGVILSKNIDRLMKLWLSGSFFDSMPSIYKTVLSDSIEEVALQMENTNYVKQSFSIHFQDGRGTIHMMIIMLEYDQGLNGIRWTKQLLVGGFVPARDWVIITHASSNFLSSSRTDEIVYLPPIMSLDHIKQYIEINKQMILSFYNMFSNQYSNSNK